MYTQKYLNIFILYLYTYIYLQHIEQGYFTVCVVHSGFRASLLPAPTASVPVALVRVRVRLTLTVCAGLG